MGNTWTNFTYSELMDELRNASDKSYAKEDGLRKAYEYLEAHSTSRHGKFRRPEKKTDRETRKSLTGKKSIIKAALKSVVSFCKSLSSLKNASEFRTWADGFANEDGKLKLGYGQFDEFEKITNQRLSELLPQLHHEDNNNWPGALSAQQTLSLFTHLCLRVHSEVPEEPQERVIEVASRIVIAPALAFAILQAGRANKPHEHARQCLEDMAKDQKSLPRPSSFESDSDAYGSKLVSRAKACIENHAWNRLMQILSDQANKFLGEDCRRQIAEECLKLLASHTEHSHGSELWKSLSKLSSTTPGANDLLVFDALKQLGCDQPNRVMRARLTCARTRYRAIESGYYDSEFRDILNKPTEEVVKHVRDHRARWDTSTKLAKAFLLSRRCLVPSDAKIDDKLKPQAILSELVVDMLESCATGNKDSDGHTGSNIDLLTLRYLAGFLTNPRFTKGNTFSLQKASDAVERYRLACKPSGNLAEGTLVQLFEGRLAWIKMLSVSDTKPDVQQIYKLYGDAAKPLFDESAREQLLDSEAPVWLLPELICLITLGDDLNNAKVYPDELRSRPEEIDRAAMNLARTIQKVGERHYGIYFNLPAEMRRIRLGLVKMADIELLQP